MLPISYAGGIRAAAYATNISATPPVVAAACAGCHIVITFEQPGMNILSPGLRSSMV